MLAEISFAGRIMPLVFVPLLLFFSVWLATPAGAAHGDPPSALDSRPANATCVAGPPPGSAGVRMQRVWTGLDAIHPFDVRRAPGGSDFYAINRAGKMYRWRPGTAPVLVLDVAARVGVNNAGNAYVNEGSEHWGLVSLAFPPDFQDSGHVFVIVNGRQQGQTFTTSYVYRYTLTGDRSRFDPATQLLILSQAQRGGYLHHFDHLAFGPDGMLYINSGDGTLNENERSSPAQLLGDIRGKILRIDVSSSTPGSRYRIPADNPWAGQAGLRGEVWARGLRNPWRSSFDPATGELWLGDVGSGDVEEVNLVQRGRNYGWPVYEGRICLMQDRCALAQTPPAYSWTRYEWSYAAVAGAFVYRGSALPSLRGKIIVPVYGANKLFAITRNGGQYSAELLLNMPPLSNWFTDAAGELYGIDPLKAHTYKLVPGSGTGDDGIPQLLSQTGCVQLARPWVAKGMIPFAVNSQLWSDGAAKRRFVALPDNARVSIRGDGDFTFPAGTVLQKSFWFNGKPFETRLLKRHTNGAWAGYTYQWNAAGSDATLVPAEGRTIQVRNNAGALIDWRLPGRGECMACHTQAAGFVLGPEIAQLNGNLTYPNGRTGNQLATWSHIGLFDGPLPGAIPDLPKLANPLNTAMPAQARARSYLHSNCAGCHRPGNPLRVDMDLRYQTGLAGMKVCNVTPKLGTLGIVDGKLLYPGRPDLSVIPRRMRIRGPNQMPPLATSVVHAAGANAVSTWIRQVQACN